MKDEYLYNLKATFYSVVVIGLFYLAGVGLYNATSYHEEPAPNQSYGLVQDEGPMHQDPTLLQRASELGIDVSQLNLVLGEQEVVENPDAKAAFVPPRSIYVKPGLDEHSQRELLAHEYLHYRWTNQTRTPDVTQSYIVTGNAIPRVANMLSQYDCDNNCIAEEAHSYICTIAFPEDLTEATNNYCNSMIPNRSILF